MSGFMVVTDLDGTLFAAGARIGPTDLRTLHELGERRVWRVAATGRNLYSARKVLAPDFPIDYLVFSTGAGVLRWPTRELLHSSSLTAGQTAAAAEALREAGLDYMVHLPIPENHRFTWYPSGRDNPDFRRRCEIYGDFARAGDPRVLPAEEACQLLAVDPDHGSARLYQSLRRRLPELKVIRTTSPLDGRSTWIEIFPPAVSKASGCAWLAGLLEARAEEALAVGNDYNDLDLLEWAGTSFLVANAPEELKRLFPVVPSNEEEGFSRAVERWERARQAPVRGPGG